MIRLLFVLSAFICAALGYADFQALYKKPANLATSNTYRRVVAGPDQTSYVLAFDNDTEKYTVRKFNSAGSILWTSGTFPPSGYDAVDFYDLAVDESGNVYLAGRRRVTGETKYKAVVYKLRTSTGSILWSRGHTYAATGSTLFTHVMYRDSKITAVLSGNLFSGVANQLIQWDTAGAELGTTGGVTGPTVNTPEGFAYHNGEFYTTGYTTGSPNRRGFIRRYNAALALVATTYYQVGSNNATTPRDISIADTGEVCITGDAASSTDYYGFMVAFDPDFNLLVEDLTQMAINQPNSGIAMFRIFTDRVGGQLKMTGIGGKGASSLGLDRFSGRQIAIPSGQVLWTTVESPIKTSGLITRDSYGDYYWAGLRIQQGASIAVEKLGRDTGVSKALFTTAIGNGFDSANGLAIDSVDEPRLVGARDVSNNVQDGTYWHLVQTPEPKADSFIVQNGVVTSLAVFGNDRFVHPGCGIAIMDTPSHGTAAVNGAKTAIDYTPTAGYLGPDSFTYRVTRGTLSATATVTLAVRGFLTSVSADRNPIAGQNQTFGRVSLSGAAPAGGAVIAISDNSTLINTPPNATVPAGATQGTFVIKVDPVTSQQTRTITAVYLGVTKTVDLVLNPLVPTAISFTPNPLVGGGTTSCKVVINGVAGAGGRTIAIVENSPYCTPPTTVTVPAGAGSITFDIPTSHPTTQQVVTVTARVTAAEVSAILRINP